jgi:hypothetical protein
LASVLSDEKARIEEVKGDDKRYQALKARADLGVFWSRVGLIRRVLYKEFGKKWVEHLKKTQLKNSSRSTK